MGVREIVAGGVITVFIGGAAYNVSQEEVAENFADDTGLTQQQAEQYVSNVDQDDLIPYDQLGNDLIRAGNDTLNIANEIDCVNYTYEWESSTLSCQSGKSQLIEVGNNEQSLGRAYISLSADSAGKVEARTVITAIDRVNASYNYPIVSIIWGASVIEEDKKSNSYNKATLQAYIDNN